MDTIGSVADGRRCRRSCLRRWSGWFWRALVTCAVGVAPALAWAGEPAPAPALSTASVPAAGRQEALVTISAFGRYALTATSKQGTALQLVDRMAGPGETRGAAGSANGRLDVLLDRGEYKLVTYSHNKGTGEAKLEVKPFLERNAPRPPLLVEHKLIEAALDDLTQLSYWIDVTERRTVILEAAGRNLADLRLWESGTWLVDAVPGREVVQPKVGKPLQVCRLAVDLNPGLYLLTAYGGVSQPWADDSGEHPFYLRAGIPTAGMAQRRRFEVSPFGIDRFLVPSEANYFRIELPEARPALLRAGPFAQETPFAAGGSTAEVSKKSVPPAAELNFSNGSNEPTVVTVTAEAGQAYVLQHFYQSHEYQFKRDGNYWLSTVHAGHVQDSIDASAIVVKWDGSQRVQPFRTDVVEVDTLRGWARRCNLVEPATLYFKVGSTGTYEVVSKGTTARFRFEPFLVSRPSNYKPPEFKATASSSWSLDAGFWVLTIEPVKKGILDVVVKPQGLVDKALDLLGTEREFAARPVRGATRFPDIALEGRYGYTIYISNQPGVSVGAVLRELPLDLREPLPLVQQPDEKVSVPFKAEEVGTLRAIAEDGQLLEIAVDGGAWSKTTTPPLGTHTVAVRTTGKDTVVYSLGLEPERLSRTAPLPPVPDTRLAMLPDYPVLTDSAPAFFDLDRSQSRTFLVKANEPALYRIESSGLLRTAGNLRSRVVTSLASESANGVGRNFFVEQYLREGDYQMTVRAQGASRGHLGAHLERTPLLAGGALQEGVSARISLPAGAGVVYTFEIAEAAEYALQALGMGRTFRCRLEDREGWPITTPNVTASISRWFAAGEYRLVVLPEPVDSRCVTTLKKITDRQRFVGHGPHRLPLSTSVEHRWLEPAKGAPRTPDSWQLELPAPAKVNIVLSEGMRGELVRATGEPVGKVAEITGGVSTPVQLSMGSYQLRVMCARINNQVDYTVQVTPDELLAGEAKSIGAPGFVWVSIGREGLYELSSSGESDVRAVLLSGGTWLASNDDRPDDWNFHVATQLQPGRYRLQVEPVGRSAARCVVRLDAPPEVEDAALRVPASISLTPGMTTRLLPVEGVGNAELLVVQAQAQEAVACQLEAREPTGWRALGQEHGRDLVFAVPLPQPAPPLRLRVWSIDRRGGTVTLQALPLTPARVSESQLGKGTELPMVAGSEPALGALAVTLGRPGLFKLIEPAELLAGSRPGARTEVGGANLIVASGRSLWLVGRAAAKTRVRAARHVAQPGDDGAFSVRLQGDATAPCDVPPAAGPVLVFASSLGGQPGVRFVGLDDEPRPGGAALGVGDNAAVAVRLGGRAPAAALAWSAESDRRPLEVRLRTLALPAVPVKDGMLGSWDVSVEGVAGKAFELPRGLKQVRLTVGEAIVAVLTDGETVRSVHWAGGQAFAETLLSDASRLYLLHSRPGADQVGVELLAQGVGGSAANSPAPAATLDALVQRVMGLPLLPSTGSQATPSWEATLGALAFIGRHHESSHSAPGRIRLAVPLVDTDGADFTLHVRGREAEAVWVGDDGVIARGRTVQIGLGRGHVLLAHDVGWLLGWLDRPGDDIDGRFVASPDQVAEAAQPPAMVPLSGAAKLLRLQLAEQTLLRVRTAVPVVSWLRRGEAVPEVDVHSEGCRLDVIAPAGSVEIGLRPLGGSLLWGTAEVTTSPLQEIGEGLGPEVVLAPGETRAFAFRVLAAGKIGIGVRAQPDAVECLVTDPAGRILGAGVVQLQELSPGTYLVILRATGDREPVRARPALVGLAKPPTGPPEELVRCYLSLAQGKVADCSSREPEPPPGRAEPAEEESEEGEGEGEEEPDGEGGEGRARDVLVDSTVVGR
jgi:hypothetical protein